MGCIARREGQSLAFILLMWAFLERSRKKVSTSTGACTPLASSQLLCTGDVTIPCLRLFKTDDYLFCLSSFLNRLPILYDTFATPDY